jgi:hypothetical protein
MSRSDLSRLTCTVARMVEVVRIIAETPVGPLSLVASDTVSEKEIVAAIVASCRRVVGLTARRRRGTRYERRRTEGHSGRRVGRE